MARDSGLMCWGKGQVCVFIQSMIYIEQGSESWNSVLINLCIFFMVL